MPRRLEIRPFTQAIKGREPWEPCHDCAPFPNHSMMKDPLVFAESGMAPYLAANACPCLGQTGDDQPEGDRQPRGSDDGPGSVDARPAGPDNLI